MMAEKPILFSGEMVRAILAGRKTQTRRVAKTDKPKYAIGDILWVREAWVELIAVSPATDEPLEIGPGEKPIENPTFRVDKQGNKRWNYDGTVIAYRANSNIEFCDGDGFSNDAANRSDMPRWRPSIHMPRKAARLFLRVTNVRCVRLQDITEADAKAEGVTLELPTYCEYETYVDSFGDLWDSLNAKRGYGWETNPLVWVIEFERVESCQAL